MLFYGQLSGRAEALAAWGFEKVGEYIFTVGLTPNLMFSLSRPAGPVFMYPALGHKSRSQ
jgi:hypothetical protein